MKKRKIKGDPVYCQLKRIAKELQVIVWELKGLVEGRKRRS